MSVFALLIAGALFGLSENGSTDYRTAYERSVDGNKPLLVLVTAEWCPPCRTMKSTTIPELLAKDAFRDFNYATVDLGKEEQLARKLIGNRGVPQLIVLRRKTKNGSVDICEELKRSQLLKNSSHQVGAQERRLHLQKSESNFDKVCAS